MFVKVINIKGKFTGHLSNFTLPNKGYFSNTDANRITVSMAFDFKNSSHYTGVYAIDVCMV